jgi:hypothetical protein
MTRPEDQPMTDERDPALDETVRRLEAERPVPRPAYRGELRRRLMAEAGRLPQPTRVRRLILAYAGSGFCLLAVAAVGLAGVGPLAA